jgi:hypothetical protein
MNRYARMPKELLPTVIKVLCSRLLNKLSNKTEHYAVLVSFFDNSFIEEPVVLGALFLT